MGRVVEKQRMVKCSIGQSERRKERKVVMLMKCRYIRKQADELKYTVIFCTTTVSAYNGQRCA